MSRDWIGIADDLNEIGVVGPPYAQSSAPSLSNQGASASPSGMGRAKKVLLIGGVLAVAAITPPGKAVIAAIEGKFMAKQAPAVHESVEYHDDEEDAPQEQAPRPAPAAAQKKAAAPVTPVAPTRKPVEPTPKKPAPKPQPAPSMSLPAEPEGAGTAAPPEPAVEPEIDLTKFRNLTGRI